jgi:hypothetical protein
MPPRDILGFFGRLPRAAIESGGGPRGRGVQSTPRSGIQFVIGYGQPNRSNGATISETIMLRVRRPEFGELCGLSAVRGSVPFS